MHMVSYSPLLAFPYQVCSHQLIVKHTILFPCYIKAISASILGFAHPEHMVCFNEGIMKKSVSSSQLTIFEKACMSVT